jgi:hypothetical protein
VLGLSAALGEAFGPWFLSHRERLVARFRQDTYTVLMEDDGNRVKAHFVLSTDEASGLQETDDENQAESRNAQHEAALRRISTLCKLLPDRKEFGCQVRTSAVEPGTAAR